MKIAFHIEEINPELFTWDNYENDYGGRLDLDYRQSTDLKVMEREIKRRAIGYCQGSRLSVRPKSDMYGIMLEDDDGEKFWFHYPRTCLDRIIDGINWEKLDKFIHQDD